MSPIFHILLVDDEPILLETLSYSLRQAGYQVTTATRGMMALELAHQEQIDLFLLDVKLPDVDGIELCRQLRSEKVYATTPIMFITARSDEIDKVIGLEVGADDYLTKPFGKRELLARVRALLRRAEYATLPSRQSMEPPNPDIPSLPLDQRDFVAGPLSIDFAARHITCRGKRVELQGMQFNLLVYLARHRGTVLTRAQLLNAVWGYEYQGDTRTVDVHIRWLREKIEEDPAHPTLLQTVRGIGYVLRS